MCLLKKQHAYGELPPSKNPVSEGKNVRTNTLNSAYLRALDAVHCYRKVREVIYI